VGGQYALRIRWTLTYSNRFKLRLEREAFRWTKISQCTRFHFEKQKTWQDEGEGV
jgi:hypothetical protein